MRADLDDQLSPIETPKRFPLGKLLLALVVLAGLVFWWYWKDQPAPPEAASNVPPTVANPPQPVIPPAPDIPHRSKPVIVPAPAGEAPVEQPEPVAATPLTAQESDEIFRKQVALVGVDAKLGKLANTEHPLDVSAALLDGMSRGIILRKILPLDPPKSGFHTVEEGDSIFMSNASYARYNGYAQSIASLESELLVDSFHTLRPLYERAYEQLGLDAGDFDNAVIRTLDVILATPEIEEAIGLQRKSVMYTYADPELESLSSLQKQLLRMGPANIRLIKRQAQAIRDGLLAQ